MEEKKQVIEHLDDIPEAMKHDGKIFVHRMSFQRQDSQQFFDLRCKNGHVKSFRADKLTTEDLICSKCGEKMEILTPKGYIIGTVIKPQVEKVAKGERLFFGQHTSRKNSDIIEIITEFLKLHVTKFGPHLKEPYHYDETTTYFTYSIYSGENFLDLAQLIEEQWSDVVVGLFMKSFDSLDWGAYKSPELRYNITIILNTDEKERKELKDLRNAQWKGFLTRVETEIKTNEKILGKVRIINPIGKNKGKDPIVFTSKSKPDENSLDEYQVGDMVKYFNSKQFKTEEAQLGIITEIFSPLKFENETIFVKWRVNFPSIHKEMVSSLTISLPDDFFKMALIEKSKNPKASLSTWETKYYPKQLKPKTIEPRPAKKEIKQMYPLYFMHKKSHIEMDMVQTWDYILKSKLKNDACIVTIYIMEFNDTTGKNIQAQVLVQRNTETRFKEMNDLTMIKPFISKSIADLYGGQTMDMPLFSAEEFATNFEEKLETSPNLVGKLVEDVEKYRINPMVNLEFNWEKMEKGKQKYRPLLTTPKPEIKKKTEIKPEPPKEKEIKPKESPITPPKPLESIPSETELERIQKDIVDDLRVRFTEIQTKTKKPLIVQLDIQVQLVADILYNIAAPIVYAESGKAFSPNKYINFDRSTHFIKAKPMLQEFRRTKPQKFNEFVMVIINAIRYLEEYKTEPIKEAKVPKEKKKEITKKPTIAKKEEKEESKPQMTIETGLTISGNDLSSESNLFSLNLTAGKIILTNLSMTTGSYEEFVLEKFNRQTSDINTIAEIVDKVNLNDLLEINKDPTKKVERVMAINEVLHAWVNQFIKTISVSISPEPKKKRGPKKTTDPAKKKPKPTTEKAAEEPKGEKIKAEEPKKEEVKKEPKQAAAKTEAKSEKCDPLQKYFSKEPSEASFYECLRLELEKLKYEIDSFEDALAERKSEVIEKLEKLNELFQTHLARFEASYQKLKDFIKKEKGRKKSLTDFEVLEKDFAKQIDRLHEDANKIKQLMKDKIKATEIVTPIPKKSEVAKPAATTNKELWDQCLKDAEQTLKQEFPSEEAKGLRHYQRTFGKFMDSKKIEFPKGIENIHAFGSNTEWVAFMENYRNPIFDQYYKDAYLDYDSVAKSIEESIRMHIIQKPLEIKVIEIKAQAIDLFELHAPNLETKLSIEEINKIEYWLIDLETMIEDLKKEIHKDIQYFARIKAFLIILNTFELNLAYMQLERVRGEIETQLNELKQLRGDLEKKYAQFNAQIEEKKKALQVGKEILKKEKERPTPKEKSKPMTKKSEKEKAKASAEELGFDIDQSEEMLHITTPKYDIQFRYNENDLNNPAIVRIEDLTKHHVEEIKKRKYFDVLDIAEKYLSETIDSTMMISIKATIMQYFALRSTKEPSKKLAQANKKIAKGEDLTDDDRVVLGEVWLQKHSTEDFKTLIFWNYAPFATLDAETDNYEFVLALQKIFPQFYKKIPAELSSLIASSENSQKYQKYVREGGFKKLIEQAVKDIGKESLAKLLIKNDVNVFHEVTINSFAVEGLEGSIDVMLNYQSMTLQYFWDRDGKLLFEIDATWDHPFDQYSEGSKKAEEKLLELYPPKKLSEISEAEAELKQTETRLEQALAEEKRISEEFKTATWPMTEKLKGQTIENGNIIERLRAKITKLKQVKKD
jgi:hypothetical protein